MNWLHPYFEVKQMSHSDSNHFFDKPANVKRLMLAFYICCGILIVLDFVIHRHTYHPLERVWAFYPIYGFIGCVALVVIAKWMRVVLMRDENYYDRDEEQRLDAMSPAHAQEDHHVGH